MAIKKINENPKVTDKILFELPTPNSNGCFLQNPYQVKNVTVYYIERNFIGNKFGELESTVYPEDVKKELKEAKELACQDPTSENLQEVIRIKDELNLKSSKEMTFYNESTAVLTIGDEDFPAWLNPDDVPPEVVDQVIEDNILVPIEEDENGDPQFGHFELYWEPIGQREGTYVVCWTWYPLIAGDQLKAHKIFNLSGNTAVTASIPSHFTQAGKYEELQNRYLPEMFKNTIAEGDLTREVLRGLNNSVAAGFTLIEDLANQTIDLIDSNVVQEAFLPALGNLFDLNLKSNDPTLWRRQIKRAIPLFKKKGTLNGLKEALEVAGMKLNSLTRLWQIASEYTFQELLDVTENGQSTFELSKEPILPINTNNFELYYRGINDNEWTVLNYDYVDIDLIDDKPILTWIGDTLLIDPISLSVGDSIRVLYEIIEVPGGEQATEEYIRLLPLSDDRDERNQEYPIKNWNVRLIEEDDPLFDVLISTRHPYYDPVIYGKIRTEIPYSENIYNMEEYNGSTRDSILPCDIDKDFVDRCGYCQSSKINLDIEIDELSNDRILESQEIIKEFIPFHNMINVINFNGSVNEFIQAEDDGIQILARYDQEDFVISGNGQNIFSRTMTNSEQITRQALADGSAVVTNSSGIAYNGSVVVFAPDIRFDRLGINESTNILEVFSPSSNAGIYSIGNISGQHADITSGSVSESPLNENQFTFRLSQDVMGEVIGADIYQDDLFIWKDENVNFNDIGTKSKWDVLYDEHYTGGPWKIEITSSGSGTYEINNILPNGDIILYDEMQTLPTSNMGGGVYNLLDDDDQVIASSDTGILNVTRRGRVDLSNSSISYENIRNIIKLGWYFSLSSGGSPVGDQYRISGFTDSDGSSVDYEGEFYISDYTDGNNLGEDSLILNRLVDNQVGNFEYKNIYLEGGANHENLLPVLNGVNAVSEDDQIESDEFKENYLILIDNVYYGIEEIDGNLITLSGPHNDWTTLSNGGTPVTYDIWRFTKNGADIPERIYPPVPGNEFDILDRRGNEVIEISTEISTPMMSLKAATLNNAKQNEMIEEIQQAENITFAIEWRDETSD